MSSETGTFIKEEKLSQAAQKGGLFKLYFRLFNDLELFKKVLPLTLVVVIAASIIPSFYRWYSGALANGESQFTLTGLVAVTLGAILLRIAAWALFEVTGMWSSNQIHHRMVEAMAKTRTTFFDENPSSRLINRLVRDFDEVRSTSIIFAGDLVNASIEILSVAGIAAFANPLLALLIFPLVVIISYIQKQRSLMLEYSRGLSAIATGKVIGRKTDLIDGREIFLLYGKSSELLKRMALSFRDYVRANALHSQIETWASFWVRITTEVFVFFVLLGTAFALHQHQISPTLAGVIISSLFGLSGSIGWFDFASSMVARGTPHLQRVYEFVDLPKEETEERKSDEETLKMRSPSTAVPVALDLCRDLVFENYTMSYRKDTPVILNNLSLSIKRGEKIALIGRTGSGKTSVVQSLLRMVYVHSGDLKLGDQSLLDFDLLEVRRIFGVVPQSPYLFTGTIRSSLDRLGIVTDDRLRKCLDTVELPYSLDHVVSEGGLNLSVGERQLICLARVLASGRQIILMDEPTSGLDPKTDAQITRVLRVALVDKTLITIAHRQESLHHYDRLIEMKDGKIIGEGAPSTYFLSSSSVLHKVN